ncbi:hypothetical protein Zmor_000563 [Zophobas morio]|uniref:XPA C-terminal domain-containing protein n=1 Tax=Zophobas morio TaxID=2755281 RepID=A0AA38MRU0_9CUCU|nr:hypothetical protein Zmor_000563 [Zophobas morio]
MAKATSQHYKDSGGWFLLKVNTQTQSSTAVSTPKAPILKEDRPNCTKCAKPIASSWLFDNFDYPCCDSCKHAEENKLITKTEALNKYILKRHDLDKREPPLKYIKRKNLHNSHWGNVKLYMELQVVKRALEVWGSFENMEKERQQRTNKKMLRRTKQFYRQVKGLRMNTRSSLCDGSSSAHVHEFGSEEYNEEEDNYTRRCLICSYVETFEKM